MQRSIQNMDESDTEGLGISPLHLMQSSSWVTSDELSLQFCSGTI